MFFGTLRTSVRCMPCFSQTRAFCCRRRLYTENVETGANQKRESKKRVLTALRQLDKIQLLALLWPRHMRRQERIHEGLEVRSPPLSQRIPNLPLPLIDALAAELGSDGREPLVQPLLEAGDLFGVGGEVVSWSEKHPQLY